MGKEKVPFFALRNDLVDSEKPDTQCIQQN